MRPKIRRGVLIAVAAIFFIPLFILFGGEVVMHLWNWLLPSLFGWRAITFWQAVGLLALCRILFGSFGGRRHYRSNFRRRMAERWDHISPEEREKFRQGMRGRCGYGGANRAEPTPQAQA